MVVFCVLLGLIFIVYGIIVSTVGSGTGFFMIWIAGGGVLILVSCFFKRLNLPFRILLCGSAAVVICIISIFCLMILRDFHDEPEKDVDYLIILGAQVRGGGPSRVLKYRLDTACAYMKLHPDTKCIVSGAKGKNEAASEAAVMRQYLMNRGISGSRILPEEKARNTAENIKYSISMIEERQAVICIVTNNFHMFRALGIAGKQGIRADGLAAPSTLLYLPNNMLREALGCMKDLAAGNMSL